MDTQIPEELIEKLHHAQSVAVLTGAGISAESGVPTFRGENGLWKKFRPEELANFDAFMQNPKLVWEWYAYRRKIIEEVQPNPGHLALVRLEEMIPSFVVITQNVDNLHQRAGSRNVVELHGNILRNRCLVCGRIVESETLDFSAGAPKCPQCGGMLRPDVVWFGEMLPEAAVQKAYRAAETCDVFMVLGTSAVVYPAASLPEIAFRQGAFVVEINVEETPVTDFAHVSLRGKTGDLLPRIVEALEK
ncbi:MAG: NAD-dependent deacylase [Calditrichaeota bacterium]|nr:NAD-dependent deacylase [Calditrichota bacterium]